MKKIYSILAAGVLGLLALSCVKESQAVFDISKATAPVLGSYELGEDAITATYTPAVFKMGFNEKIAPNHTLALVSLDGQKVSKTLTTSDKDGVLTLKNLNLAKALMTMGKAEGSTASVELAVRASMQEPSKDNGRNGYVDSDGHITIGSFEVVIPEIVGSPYAEYTEASTWSVIGSLSAYEISWDGDLNMWTDGNNHVAAHVKLAAGDEFKFRKDASWDVNMGGDFGSLDTEFSVSQDGPNIKVGADGVYDLYLNPLDGTAWITLAYDPLPDYTEASNWSVIGSLSKQGISWDGDVSMISNGTWHVALGVDLAAADEFKFRQDASWDVNLGGDFGGMDTEFAVSQDGPNIKVGAEGSFDLYVNPSDGLAKVTEASGAKVSAKIGGGEEPEPEQITGWNIIGLNGDWDNDILATQNGNVWTAYVTATENTAFKWRKDGGWDENYGGTLVTLGEPFEAVPGGSDIAVAAGFYKVELDTEAKTITVSEGNVYSLIGEIDGDSWTKDIYMTEKNGVWTSVTVSIEGGFKIRHNASWADENVYGAEDGFTAEAGKAFTAVQPGSNISIAPGQYKVTFNPATKEVLIGESKYPEHLYMIGEEFGGWDWNSDGVVEMVPVVHQPDWGAEAEGQFWTVRYISAGKGFKFCSQRAWSGDFWGLTYNDGFTEAGGNCTVAEDGIYLVHIDFKNEKVHVEPARVYGIGNCFGGWTAAMEGALFQADGRVLKATTQEEGELRMFVESAIATSDWWTREFIFFEDGAIDYRGDDEGQGDQARRSVLKGQVVTLDFNAGTGTVSGEGEVSDDPKAWSLVGTIGDTGWGTDFDLKNTSGSIWVIENVAVGAADEFKIRADHDWAKSVGGPEGNDVSTIDAGNPYEVYKPAIGVAFTAGDKNIRIGVEGVYTITFDYKANTILIEEYQEFPEHLYMIGEEFGGWDWGSDGVVEMTPVLNKPEWGSEAPGQFYTIRFIHAGKGFKFCSQRAWSGDFWGLDTNDGFTESGGNCTVAEDGVYLVHVDFKNGKVHVEPARVYGIGDCFGGWNEEMSGALFATTDGKVSQTVPNDGNVRMYVASAIATSPWWSREFNVLDGKITPRILDELAGVPVKAGDKVTLDFNAGTGTIGSEGGQGGAVKITIDGDMSDWAAVEGASADHINSVFKVASDENNIYFYVKRSTDRMSEIWEGAAYHYYTFDLDGDATTGEELWGNGPYEILLVIYPYAGTAAAPAFGIAKEGTAVPGGCAVDKAVIKGVVTESGVETEISIARSDLIALPSTPVTVYSWSNKGGGDKLSVTTTL